MSELFPNAPLVQAIFQLRFAGETAIETARPAFQDAVRSELPKLYVSRAEAGVAPPLQPYTFRNEQDTECVELSINTFTYWTRDYKGFSVFQSRFRRFFDALATLVTIHKLNRVGLRYINHIPILRSGPSAPIPLEDFLTVSIRLPDRLGRANLTELNSAFTLDVDGGSLRVVLQHLRLDTPSADEVILVDFDFAQADSLHVANLGEYLKRAHDQTKETFLSLVSEKYLPVIKGEAR